MVRSLQVAAEERLIAEVRSYEAYFDGMCPYEAGQHITADMSPNYYEGGAAAGASSESLPCVESSCQDTGLLHEVQERIALFRARHAGEDLSYVDEDTFILGVVMTVFQQRNRGNTTEGNEVTL